MAYTDMKLNSLEAARIASFSAGFMLVIIGREIIARIPANGL